MPTASTAPMHPPNDATRSGAAMTSGSDASGCLVPPHATQGASTSTAGADRPAPALPVPVWTPWLHPR